MVSILHFPARKRRTSLYERKFNVGVGRLQAWGQEHGLDADAVEITAEIGREVRIKNYRLMQRIARTIDEYGAKCERLGWQDQLSEKGE